MLNQGQQEIAEKIGSLLAQSPLEDELKELVLDSIDKLPDYMIVELMQALESESEKLDQVVTDIELFLKDRDSQWDQLAEDQKAAANSIIDKYEKKIDDEMKLEEARGNLADL